MMRRLEICYWFAAVLWAWGWTAGMAFAAEPAAPRREAGLTIAWKDNYLTIRGEKIPGGEISILYLEAYCRPGSTDRDWHDTLIKHRTELLSASADQRRIKLRCTLVDGVTIDHVLTAGADEVDFRLTATNPTTKPSEVAWAQPCMRVDKFTGTDPRDARELHPAYIRRSFIFLDGKLTMLPTEPWALRARYTPGQVYAPRGVDRNDVNPRPLSTLVPSNGLMGCYSADKSQVLAVAWEPYQELFQGVIACLHSDFRIGGLGPGETKQIRGKVYVVGSDIPKLVRRYEADFPEHKAGKK